MLQVTIQNTLSISTTFPFTFTSSILATTTLKVTSLTTGSSICEIHTRNLAETFCHKSGTVHTIMLHLKYPSTPNQSSVLWTVFSINMSLYTHVQHFLELQANTLMPFFSGYQIRIPPSFLETLWLIRV